ncbi:MAG: T9SS type A sorting domain-containing protein, partial [Crocinitomicaceae bacterium]
DSTVYIAFVLRTFDGYKLYIDDLLVEKDIDTNSVTSVSIPTINLYPNPTEKWVNITGTNSPVMGDIWNSQGLLVKKFDSSQVDVEDLQSGVYVMSLLIQDQIIKKRFVKK